MRKFTPEEDQFLRDNYLTIPACTMSHMLKRCKVAAPQRMKLLGIVTPDEVKQKFKAGSYYKSGHQPDNKGKKITEFMSAEAIERSKTGRFAKDIITNGRDHNWKQDGEICTRRSRLKTGEQRPYKYIRLSKSKWQMLHVHLWEELNGKAPAGHIIVFKDKDTMNCVADNLECISLQENMRRNSYHRFGVEIAGIIQLRGVLTRAINKKTKLIYQQTTV